MQLDHRIFRPGEKILHYGYVIAQDKLHIVTDGNMELWYFTYPDRVLVHWMNAQRRGSGKLLQNIRELEAHYGRPVHVADPLFARLVRFLDRNRIPYCSPRPEVSIRRPRKPKLKHIRPFDGRGMLPDGALEYFDLYTEQMMNAPDTPDGKRFEMRMTPEMRAAIVKFYPEWQNAKPEILEQFFQHAHA